MTSASQPHSESHPGSFTALLHQVVQAAPQAFLSDLRRVLAINGVAEAVQRRDTAVLFDHLVEAFAYQGISDAIALQYMDEHGRVAWADIASRLRGPSECP